MGQILLEQNYATNVFISYMLLYYFTDTGVIITCKKRDKAIHVKGHGGP
jgi:hypothetical protein